MNSPVSVNPSCFCLLSSGGLYIDSAYYQPQTIAAPIIIHLGPQDLFWPHWCTATGLGSSLDLLFNPSPLLNSVSESQLLRCCSPGLHLPHETQQQYWKQYGGENTSGNTLSSPGGVSVRRSLQLRLWLKGTPVKHEAILLLPIGNLNMFQSQDWKPERVSAGTDTFTATWTTVCKKDIYYLYIWMCVSFAYTYINMWICLNISTPQNGSREVFIVYLWV